MQVKLVDLVRAAIKEDVAGEALQNLLEKGKLDRSPAAVVEALNGWTAGGALVLKHDMVNHGDTGLRAVFRIILERRCGQLDFVSFPD